MVLVKSKLGRLAPNDLGPAGEISGGGRPNPRVISNEIAAQAVQRAAKGITAIRFRGFHSYDDVDLHDHRLAVRQQVAYMAAIRDAIEDGGSRGASTLSQQTVKNLYLWHGRNYTRKALEALMTPALEALWPKKRIVDSFMLVSLFPAIICLVSFIGLAP